MDIPKKNRFGGRLAGAALALLLFTGCATTGSVVTNGPEEAKPEEAAAEAPAAAEAEPGKSVLSVESVSVVGDGDRVLVETTGPVKYTVFRLSEPSRLIIDMPGVSLEKISGEISVGNSYISEISTANYGDREFIGRVTIGLKEGVDHDVKSGENSILISLVKEPSASAPSNGEVVKATALAPEEAQPAPQAPSVEAATEVSREESLKPATKILKVDSYREGDNTVIRIAANGPFGSYNSFELDKNPRIVIDIWGVENATGKSSIKLDDRFIKTARLGNHPGKTRIVFDSASGLKAVPTHSVRKEGDTLLLTVGKDASAGKAAGTAPVQVASIPREKALEEAPATYEPSNGAAEAPVGETGEEPAMAASVAKEPVAVSQAEAPEAPEAPAEPVTAQAQEPSGVTIEGVDFKRLPDKARLTVTSSGKADYSVKETEDGRTVAIDIKGATIPDRLVRTLDATKLKTPVASISSYQESTRPVRSVRVLVSLSEGADYAVKDQDGTITVDFTPKKAAAITMKEAAAMAAVPEEKKYTGKRIDLDMTDANISDILRLMAEVSNLNIIASDDVKGTISLRLKNVPWDQAFDIILKSKGLDSIREGNVVRVAPIARIRQEKEQAIASVKAEEKLEDPSLEFIPISYANAEEMISQIKNVLTERGSVTSEKRTNTLIVRDIRKGIDAAKGIVKKLDTPIPQVLIEARIVEATSSFARDLGIQWGVDYQTGGNVSTDTFGSTTTAGQTPPASTTQPAFATRHGADNFAVNLPASGTAGTLGALGFVFGKAGSNPLVLDLRLTAGEQEGRLKTISRPRITTLDNKEAKIEQGESIPFETTSAAGTATTFIDANLSLTVTPHITPDGSVLMKIKASRNSIGTFRTSAGEPSINKKEASTEVLVKDGETTVIGGIVISDKSETDRGVPFLKDIPILGWLFKNKSVSDSQTELLIFLTPTIIKEKDKTVG